MKTIKFFLSLISERNPPPIQKLVSQVITPNGDGQNDTWKISGYHFSSQSRIKIYNHNRDLIYQFEGLYQNDWDGKSLKNGETLTQGSYYFTIDLNGDGLIDLQGWLYIKS